MAQADSVTQAHLDVERLMELREECGSVSGATQTDASTVCFDMTQEPLKVADDRTIVKSLKRAGSHDVVKAGKGCDEVAWLCLEVGNRELIGAQEGVEVLLKTMQRWMGKRSAIVEACMLGLSRLLTCWQNVESFYEYQNPLLEQLEKESGYAGGGTLLVIAAMSGYPLKTDIQQYGCTIAAEVSKAEVYLKRFYQYGLVGQVLHALETHPECVGVVVEGLDCLGKAMINDEAVRWMVDGGVVLDYYAEGLRRHLENTEVVRKVVTTVLKVQRVDGLALEVRKTTLVGDMIHAAECHAHNLELVTYLLLCITPQITYHPSLLDSTAAALKKIMSLHPTPHLLTLACHTAYRIAAASPNDAATLRLSRHLVPYISAALEAYKSDPDSLVPPAASLALSSFVVNKWGTPLGRPRQKKAVKHPSFLVVKAAAETPLKVDWEWLAYGV